MINEIHHGRDISFSIFTAERKSFFVLSKWLVLLNNHTHVWCFLLTLFPENKKKKNRWPHQWNCLFRKAIYTVVVKIEHVLAKQVNLRNDLILLDISPVVKKVMCSHTYLNPTAHETVTWKKKKKHQNRQLTGIMYDERKYDSLFKT